MKRADVQNIYLLDRLLREFHSELKEIPIQIQYLEIVTKDGDAVCASYELINGLKFGAPEVEFGNARTALLGNGGRGGVRAPCTKLKSL